MNEIQDSGISQGIVRRLNIVDVAAPAPSLAPEVFPVYLVAPPSVEDSWLRSELICSGGVETAAVLAEYSATSVLNPATSGILAIIDEIVLTVQVGVGFVDGIVPTSAVLGGTLVASGARDGRLTPSTTTTQTQCGLYKGGGGAQSFAASGKALAQYFFPAAGTQIISLGYVIPPGYRYDIWCNTTNQLFIATIRWRERRAQPSELG